MPKPADEWMVFALGDLRSGEVLFQADIFDTACFHAQQAAEKALKGFLADHNVSHPRTHDLIKLNNLCSKIDGGFSGLMAKVVTLNQFYTPTRYPDAAAGMASEGIPDKDTARKALGYARDVVGFCSERTRDTRYLEDEAAKERDLSDDRDDN